MPTTPRLTPRLTPRMMFAALALLAASTHALAQQTATAFTYQGRLTNSGDAVDVKLDIAFTLYNSDVGGEAVSETIIKAVDPIDGLFTTELDFGAAALIADSLWLEIEVRPQLAPAQLLSPRQRVTAAPTAVQTSAVTNDGRLTIVDPRGLTDGTEIYIDNAGTVQSTTSVDVFWQSFRTQNAARFEYAEFLVKRPAGAPPPSVRIRRGEGASGDSAGSVTATWGSSAGGGFQYIEVAPSFEDPRDAIELDANETYSVVFQTLPEDNLAYAEVAITDPNAGRSSVGPNVATSFRIGVASEVEPAAYFDGPDLVVGSLKVDDTGGFGALQIESKFPGILVRDTDSRDFFGGGQEINLGLELMRTEVPFTSSFWRIKALPDVAELRTSNLAGALPVFEFANEPAPRAWLRTADINLAENGILGDDIILEDNDAVLGLYSGDGGAFGSSLVFGQLDSAGSFVDKWSMTRRTTSSGNELQFAFGSNANYSANTINFALRTNGSAWLRGALQQNSTATEKHDIETLTGSIDTLLQLRGVSYKWNQTDAPDIGFVAEEMAEVLPEIVGFDEAGQPIGIDYGRLTALIVEATKAQQHQLDEQRRLILNLTQRLESLEQRDD